MTASTDTGLLTPHATTAPVHGVGASVLRPDGDLKAAGKFAFSSDLWAENMLWGHTLRSPHAHARIRGIDVSRARAMGGVRAVLTANDVPGQLSYGLIFRDQPVLADSLVRYAGEAVAIVAADDPEIARQAVASIDVDYELLPVLSDPAAATEASSPQLHAGGNVVRDVSITRGDTSRQADVVVSGNYVVGMQDQAPLGTESGLALPTSDGGVELFANTQWLHADRSQLATILALPPELIRIQLAGVGGAFGAREDISLQAHLCLLALATGRPVKMVYSREESFVGHVHRHPARLVYEHGATGSGELVYVKCDILLDGGAYASTTPAVVANAAVFAVGPYDCPNVEIHAVGVYTNNPPCGAMRGFGAVQSAFGHEAQMDLLAKKLRIEPLELRLRNALIEGSLLPTGQPITGTVPVRALLTELQNAPLPDEPPVWGRELIDLPGGVGNVTNGEDVRRGVGYAIGLKATGMTEGSHDYSTARVRLRADEGSLRAEVQSAAAEMGQGVVTIQAQIVQSELGVTDVVVLPADTSVGSAGSSSASRQTYMTGGAVRAACAALREEIVNLAYERLGHRWPDLLECGHDCTLRDGVLLDPAGAIVVNLVDLLSGTTLEKVRRYYHVPTTGIDPETGQGRPHVQFAFAAHRAVADVDVGSGLCRVVDLTVAQDVGRAVNPTAVEGQMEGGTAQGLGLALMEEIQTKDGKILNPSFTDYLIPTLLDVPEMSLHILELPDPDAPYGLKGAGEPSTVSSTPAIAAALRAASGRRVSRVPVRPQDLTEFELQEER